ncbi:hypothetical protein AMECASPLE_035448 [Ameca splendens]|uniref:Uncharacterized protein n=1 Tax=Ameca splendens TaxID=208324 RepID=A0ABV1AFI1_9TELE
MQQSRQRQALCSQQPPDPTPRQDKLTQLIHAHTVNTHAWHILMHRAGQPVPQPSDHILITAAQCLAKTPLPEPGTPHSPTRRTRHQSQGTKKIPNNLERAGTPVPAPINSQDPTPKPSLDPDQKARSFSQRQTVNRECGKTPNVLLQNAQMWC